MPRTAMNRKLPGNKGLANVWIDTVLNPILRGLIKESELMKWSFTWRHIDKRFEHLFPVNELVGGYYWPNCEQLLGHFAEFKAIAGSYDNSLEEFGRTCSSAFDVLTKDQAFRGLVKTAVAGHPDADETALRYFADYTINFVKELPTYYTYHNVWNDNTERFLELQSRADGVGAALRSVEKQGRAFAEVLEKFLASCDRLRNQLADKFGLPRVPVPTNGVLVWD